MHDLVSLVKRNTLTFLRDKQQFSFHFYLSSSYLRYTSYLLVNNIPAI